MPGAAGRLPWLDQGLRWTDEERWGPVRVQVDSRGLAAGRAIGAEGWEVLHGAGALKTTLFLTVMLPPGQSTETGLGRKQRSGQRGRGWESRP